MCELEKIVFNLLTAYSMIGIYNEGFVFVDCFKNLQKSFLPCFVCFFTLQGFGGFFQTCPLYEIIDVPEMIIKGHAADSAVGGQVVDRDFV